MRKALPSITALQAFEAYVRLGSMTAAAIEMKCVPSVVSRHIAKLEVFLQVDLTCGYRRYAKPTPAALAFAAQLTPVLGLLRQIVENRRPPAGAVDND